jgi:hypothetical protein
MKNTQTTQRIIGFEGKVDDIGRYGHNYSYRVVVSIGEVEEDGYRSIVTDIPTLEDLRRKKNAEKIARGGWW